MSQSSSAAAEQNKPIGGRSVATSPSQLPTIAVIVPVRNEERFIAGTIDALLAQDYPTERYEVLVVDGRSTDRTREIVGQYESRHVGVRLLDNLRRLSSAARNIGIRESNSEIVLVVDGHCELEDPQYLRKLADAFVRSGADCVGRPQPLEVTDATVLQRAIAAARSSRLGHHPDSYIYSTSEGFVPAHSVAVAYRRGVFDRVGYFDERFDACEDVELNQRVDAAGLRCYFTPAVAVRYYPRSSLRGLSRQLIRYGRGRVRLLQKHPGTLTFRTFAPAILVAVAVFGLVGMWFSQWFAVVTQLALVAYLLPVVGVSVATAFRQRSAAMLALLPLVFVTIHVSAGVGMLLELIRSSTPRHDSRRFGESRSRADDAQQGASEAASCGQDPESNCRATTT